MNKEIKNSNDILVSIGVPAYNGEKFLEECLESIRVQTFKKWECVIINNCSTDKTAEIAQKFVDKDNRFKLLNFTELYPIVDNWNRIYPNISENSKYLKIVQADDWITQTAIEDMYNLLEHYPTTGICFSYRIDGKIVNCDGLDYNDGPLFTGKELLIRHLHEEIQLAGSITTPLFKKEYLNKLPTYPKIFDDSEYHVDLRIVYEMLNISDAVFVFKVLSYTRWHDDAETLKLCVRLNTFLNSREHVLFRFKHLDPSIEKTYKIHRLKYAYFTLKAKLKKNKDYLNWHNQFLPRKFTFKEYLLGFLLQNGIVWRIRRISNKKIKLN